MKAYQGFKAEASVGNAYPQLEPGPYIAAIRAVKLEGAEPDQTLILRMEVIEGPAAGYFTKRYAHDSANAGQYEAKYKGDFRLRVPNLDNQADQYPQTTLRRFQDAIYRIESSNPGYRWDWNEQGLIGKTVGISMQEGAFNDTVYTAIGRLETVDDIRQGRVGVMKPRKPRYSNDYVGAGNSGSVEAAGGGSAAAFTPVEIADLPF